jgi:hypothetical protein
MTHVSWIDAAGLEVRNRAGRAIAGVAMAPIQREDTFLRSLGGTKGGT